MQNSENGVGNGQISAKGAPGASPINGQVPPVEHRFSSENQPANRGRPKGVRNIKTIFEKLLSQDISPRIRAAIEGAMGDQTVPEQCDHITAIALGQISKAIANRDTKAAELIFERIWGKPPQHIITEDASPDVRDLAYDHLTDTELDEADKAMEILENLRLKSHDRREREQLDVSPSPEVAEGTD